MSGASTKFPSHSALLAVLLWPSEASAAVYVGCGDGCIQVVQDYLSSLSQVFIGKVTVSNLSAAER